MGGWVGVRGKPGVACSRDTRTPDAFRVRQVRQCEKKRSGKLLFKPGNTKYKSFSRAMKVSKFFSFFSERVSGGTHLVPSRICGGSCPEAAQKHEFQSAQLAARFWRGRMGGWVGGSAREAGRGLLA